MVKKLSKSQQDVVDLMKAGWQLGKSLNIMRVRCFIQKGGIGRGNPESKNISISTITALIANGVIEDDPEGKPRHYSTYAYRLTKEYIEESKGQETV